MAPRYCLLPIAYCLASQAAIRNPQAASRNPQAAGVCEKNSKNSLEETAKRTSFPVLTAAIITIYQIDDPPHQAHQAPKGSKVVKEHK
jgi:hypothetical protein